MARNDSDKFWKQMAHKNKLIYNDTCYKKKALELFMCTNIRMHETPNGPKKNYEGLHGAITHYLEEPNYQAELALVNNERRKKQAKKMLRDMVRHMKGYKDIGINIQCHNGHMIPHDHVIVHDTQQTSTVDTAPQ